MIFLKTCNVYGVSITLMRLAGEKMNYTPRKIIIYRLINCFILIFASTFTFANLFYVNGELYVNTFESLITILHVSLNNIKKYLRFVYEWLQVLLKYLLYMYFKSDIAEIFFERLNKFWNYRTFNKEIIEAVEAIYSKIKVFEIVLLCVSISLGYVYMLKSVFNQNVFLFDYNTIVDSFVLEVIILTCQYYYIYLGALILLSYDLFYLLFCIDLIIQIKLLKCKLIYVTVLENDNTFEEVVSCIKHHIYLSS